MDPIIIQAAEVEEGEVATCYARGEEEALKVKVKVLVIQLCRFFATSRTVVCQSPLSMEFSSQEY